MRFRDNFAKYRQEKNDKPITTLESLSPYPSGVKGFNNKMAIWRLAATHGPEAVQTNTPINEKKIRKKKENV